MKTPATPNEDVSDRRREAAVAAIDASELEHEEAAGGSSHAVRVSVGFDNGSRSCARRWKP